MKKFLLSVLTFTVCLGLFAQVPSSFSYQAVLRDVEGKPISNQNLEVKVSIVQSGIDGEVVYVENFSIQTSVMGLINLNIGQGEEEAGNFDSILWGKEKHFVKFDVKLGNEETYTEFGTTELLSVPYALHAQTAESLSECFTEEDPLFSSWDKSTGILITESQVSDLQEYVTSEIDPLFSESVAAGVTATDTASWNHKLDSYTETDPEFSAWDKSTGIVITESQISNLQEYLTNEIDPVFVTSVAGGITAADTAEWNSKLGSYTESDPEFTTWDKTTGILITESQISDLQEYILSESDPTYEANFSTYDANVGDLLRFNGTKWEKFTPNYLTVYTETQGLSEVVAINNSAFAQIKELSEPTDEKDAATKAYVDALEARLDYLEDLLVEEGVLPIKDIDGNTYKVVKIGEQVWMAENLRVTRFPNGNEIPYVEDDAEWGALGDNNTDIAFCFQGNNPESPYGAFYTWSAAMNGAASSNTNPSNVQGVCPDGWHLPSADEFTELVAFIASDGYEATEGVALKSKSGWNSDGNGVDAYGFNGTPSGVRDPGDGHFFGSGAMYYVWSSTEAPFASTIIRRLEFFNNSFSESNFGKSNGYPVRCVKD